MNTFFRFITLLSISFLIGSCAQLSSFQTGKTLGKGNKTFGGGLVAYGVSDPESQGGELGSPIWPHAVFSTQFGISNRFDLGLQVSTGYNAQLFGKYQIIGNLDSKFAASLGAGAAMQFNTPDEKPIYRAHLPLYLSYHNSEKGAIYLTPRFVYQIVPQNEDNNSYFLGTSGGYAYKFSEVFTGFFEGSLYRPFTENEKRDFMGVYQFGFGGTWDF